MNRFFTLLLAASCLTAVGQVPNCTDYDLNENLTIDVQDVLLLLTEFGSTSEVSEADFDGDGLVGTTDVLMLLAFHGVTCTSFSCGDNVIFEDDSYSTVQIGGQCWFSENLRYLPEVTGNTHSNEMPTYSVPHYYGSSVEEAKSSLWYSVFGVQYNWHAVATGGLCPTGWHVPSDAEWTELVDFIGGPGNGGKLKEVGTTSDNSGWWNDPNLGASDEFGFGARAAGALGGGGGFFNQFAIGYYWSSTDVPFTNDAWHRWVNFDSGSINRSYYYKADGFSVRCIKDAE